MTFNANIPLATDLISNSQADLYANNQFLGSTTGNATNGYYKLPNGAIIQWGVSTGNTSGVKTVSFPISFATACYNVQFSLAFDSSGTTVPIVLDRTFAFTTTQFKYRVNASGTDWNLYWVAIGV
jgi:hypothetical protein